MTTTVLFPTAQESLFETLKFSKNFKIFKQETLEILNIILKGLKNEIYNGNQNLYIFENNEISNSYYIPDISSFQTENFNDIIEFLKYKGYKITKVFFYKKNTWAFCINW